MVEAGARYFNDKQMGFVAAKARKGRKPNSNNLIFNELCLSIGSAGETGSAGTHPAGTADVLGDAGVATARRPIVDA